MIDPRAIASAMAAAGQGLIIIIGESCAPADFSDTLREAQSMAKIEPDLPRLDDDRGFGERGPDASLGRAFCWRRLPVPSTNPIRPIRLIRPNPTPRNHENKKLSSVQMDQP